MTRIRLCSLLALSLAASSASAEMLVFHLDAERTTVHFRLKATMHAVDGTLGHGAGRIAFDPATGEAAGQVRVDLREADSGIERRDHKMHGKILDTGLYPDAVFHVERIDLPHSLRQGTNDLQLHGTMEFHGASHPVSLPAVAELAGDEVTATAWFAVPYVDWGLKDPSFFVLRVAKVVQVEIQAVGRLEGKLPEESAAAAAPAAASPPRR
jgi:polyisoprenoid-binding protein YceI